MNLPHYHQLLAGESFVYPCRNALWKLEGSDRTRYLNGQVTQDVTKLTPGQVTYATVCNAKGRMEGDVYIAAQNESYYLDSSLILRESLSARLEKYLIADDAAFTDLTDNWSLLHFFGPIPSPVPQEGFLVSHARFGRPGYDLWLPKSVTPPTSIPVDDVLVETLCLEAGLPRWGLELDTTTLPPEAGLEGRAISYTKGCYVGQETIARIKSIGHVNRCLVFLRSENNLFPGRGDKLLFEGKEVGHVTSSGFSPRLEKGLALAYVERLKAAQGTVLQVGALSLTISPTL